MCHNLPKISKKVLGSLYLKYKLLGPECNSTAGLSGKEGEEDSGQWNIGHIQMLSPS